MLITIQYFWEPLYWEFAPYLSLIINSGYSLNYILFLLLGYFIYFFALLSFINYRSSLFFSFIYIELMIIAINFIFAILGILLINFFCFLIIIYLLTLAAAETAMGLVLLILYNKTFSTTTIEILNKLNF